MIGEEPQGSTLAIPDGSSNPRASSSTDEQHAQGANKAEERATSNTDLRKAQSTINRFEIRRLGLVAKRFMLSRRCRFEEPCLQNLQLRKLHELELADVYYLSNVLPPQSESGLGTIFAKRLIMNNFKKD